MMMKLLVLLLLISSFALVITREEVTDSEIDDDLGLWDWSRHDLFEEDEHAQQHIKEDLRKLGIEDTSKMTQEELNLHYFKLHDYDNNEMMDGLELLQSFMHSYYEHDVYLKKTNEERDALVQSYVETIDDILVKYDLDNDGYLNYVEYKLAQTAPAST